MSEKRVGRAVICSVCGRHKKPWGRDSRDNGLCDHDCPGYDLAPRADSLWPGEEGDYNPPRVESFSRPIPPPQGEAEAALERLATDALKRWELTPLGDDETEIDRTEAESATLDDKGIVLAALLPDQPDAPASEAVESFRWLTRMLRSCEEAWQGFAANHVRHHERTVLAALRSKEAPLAGEVEKALDFLGGCVDAGQCTCPQCEAVATLRAVLQRTAPAVDPDVVRKAWQALDRMFSESGYPEDADDRRAIAAALPKEKE